MQSSQVEKVQCDSDRHLLEVNSILHTSELTLKARIKYNYLSDYRGKYVCYVTGYTTFSTEDCSSGQGI